MGDYMIFSTILAILSNMIYMALHVTHSGCFPPALTAKQEAKFLEQYASGDMRARDKLIEHNLRLVAHIAKKYNTGQENQDDLISIGTIGLIKAVSTFDAGKSIRLSTYASRCIENEILMYFRNLKKRSQDVFIGDPIDTDGDGNTLTLGDIISYDEDILGDLDTKMKLERLDAVIKRTLTAREYLILCMRYGLCGHIEQTQHSVAQKLKISRSYVSRIEKKALQKLRRELE